MKKVNNQIEEISNNLPKNKDITLVGGCFDLLHVAHLELLEYSKASGDILVVAVLSDNYIKKYKEVSRPIIPENYRLRLIRSLKCVDFAFICDTSSSDESVLSAIKPDNIVFGIEESQSGKNKQREESIFSILPHVKILYLKRFGDVSVSTTLIINKIKNA